VIPAGLELTVPEPVPLFVTIKVLPLVSPATHRFVAGQEMP